MGRARRIIGLAAVLSAVAAPAAAAPVKPHLVPLLPTAASAGQQAPVFVDALEVPGRVLYRFDAVIANTGGALDLFALSPSSATAGSDLRQAEWASGAPASVQNPNADPSGIGAVTVSDRTSAVPAAAMRYATAYGLADWRALPMVRYVLSVPGGADRPGAQEGTGACLSDSYGPIAPGAPSWFPVGATGGNPDVLRTWCQPAQSTLSGGADPAVARGGVSPGWGDLSPSQEGGQWVDVTGLAPGAYTLSAIANPEGAVDASPPAAGDDVLAQQRVIPGVTAADATGAAVAGGSGAVALSGAIVGPEVPARTSASGACASGVLTPATPFASCYRAADAAGPLTFAVATPPAHGTVALGAASGLAATATYTPSAGFTGTDTFTYTATDVRGLTSAPATATVTVTAAPTTRVPTLFPRLSMPRHISDVKRLAVTVRLGRRVCGVTAQILGSRRTRNSAPFHALATRRVGCASSVRLTARRPRPGLWRVRAVVLVAGRAFVSPVRRVLVSPPDPAGPGK